MPSAFGVSVTVHLGLAAVLLFWAGFQPEEVASKAPPIRTDLVFLQNVGPGGGGGGNPAPAPPVRTEIPAHNTPVIPTAAVVAPVDPPKPTLDVTVQTNLATSLQVTGTTLLAPPGPGGGGPRGSTGAGAGEGPGVGPGLGGHFGGGARGVGNGVTSPIDKKQAKPAYTACALAAKIQGTVTLDVVVLANGTVGDVKVVGSLDKKCGLDLEAIKAARQWLFVPGTFEGKPVDVLVQLILTFNLR